MSSISNSIQNALCILLLSQRTAVSHAGRFSWTSATLFVLTLANPLKWQECSERLKFSVLCSACWNKMFWCCQNIFPSLFFLKTLVEFVTSVNVPTFICKASLFWPLNCCCSLVHDMSNKRIRIERKNITFKGKKWEITFCSVGQSKSRKRYVHGYPKTEAVPQFLTACWRASGCSQQPLQDVSEPPAPVIAFCQIWAVQIHHLQGILVVLGRLGAVSQLSACNFATLLCGVRSASFPFS